VATRHLAEHGRTRIACIGGPRDVMPSTDRVEGYRRGLADAGLRRSTRLVRNVPFGRRAAYLAALELFGAPQRPDAVFVASDEQAVGVLRALTELGLRCPEDVAVASFDGIAGSAYTVPALTTVAQPFDRLGTETVHHLLARIGGDEGPRVTELAVELITRGSCGCPDPPGGDHVAAAKGRAE
jgi:LacI family transcriptional regulator